MHTLNLSLADIGLPALQQLTTQEISLNRALTEDTHTILRVAVAAPLPTLFDYLPPAGAKAVPAPGARVVVPFGRSRRVGMIVEVTDQTGQDRERLKPVDSLLDAAPVLAPADLRFILWAAGYYQQPPGEALFAALPARMRRPSPTLETGEPGWRLTPEGRDGIEGLARRAPRQAQVGRELLESPAGLATAVLTSRLGDCRPALRALATRGWAEPCRLGSRAQEQRDLPAGAGPDLNPHQQRAVDSIRGALGGFRAFLLDGVTGSGKTEVYVHLLQTVLGAGRQALVLVPEIGLTPQLLRRLARRVPVPMATLHSALSAVERERAWRRAASGDAALVVGTRSAVFVPLPRLGLILVDEEHDLSFKQQDGFRYSARDLAVRRAQQAIARWSWAPPRRPWRPCTTPAAGATACWRCRSAPAAPCRRTSTRWTSAANRCDAGLSPVLMRLMREQLDAGNQVLLFLNRRGFAPVLTCHDCGWVGSAPSCDARLPCTCRTTDSGVITAD